MTAISGVTGLVDWVDKKIVWPVGVARWTVGGVEPHETYRPKVVCMCFDLPYETKAQYSYSFRRPNTSLLGSLPIPKRANRKRWYASSYIKYKADTRQESPTEHAPTHGPLMCVEFSHDIVHCNQTPDAQGIFPFDIHRAKSLSPAPVSVIGSMPYSILHSPKAAKWGRLTETSLQPFFVTDAHR